MRYKCGICKKEIVIPGEAYCILSEYTRDDELKSDGHYHVKCYREKFLTVQNTQAMVGRTNKLLAKAERLFS